MYPLGFNRTQNLLDHLHSQSLATGLHAWAVHLYIRMEVLKHLFQYYVPGSGGSELELVRIFSPLILYIKQALTLNISLLILHQERPSWNWISGSIFNVLQCSKWVVHSTSSTSIFQPLAWQCTIINFPHAGSSHTEMVLSYTNTQDVYQISFPHVCPCVWVFHCHQHPDIWLAREMLASITSLLMNV